VLKRLREVARTYEGQARHSAVSRAKDSRDRLGALKRSAQSSRLVVVFSSMVGSQLGSAVLGVLFWAISARTLSADQVGLGAALVAAMNLFSILGVLGIGTSLLEHFKVAAPVDRSALLSTGLGVAWTGGAIVTIAWLIIDHVISFPGVLHSPSFLTGSILVAASAIAATCSAFDQAVHGMGASRDQLRRNIIASIFRIGLLLLAVYLHVKDGRVILVAWALGLVGSLVATTLLSPRFRFGSRVPPKERLRIIRSNWRAALGHHALTLAMVSSSLTLPVVVASILPATEMAFFTSARLLADSALMLPYFLTVALFAAVSDLEEFRIKARRTIALGIGLAFCLLAGAAIFGKYLLLAFGSTYSQAAQSTLLLLLLVGPVLVIKDHFVALKRMQQKRKQGAIAMTIWTGAELGGALAGAAMGTVRTLCIGWISMSAICALIALPVLVRSMRKPPANCGEVIKG
jgi:O-antigen/teichoic acid export membrane protein